MLTKTMLETDEEIRRTLEDLGWREIATDQSIDKGTERNSYSKTTEVAFRPTLRTAQACLTVFDDGQATGEIIRLRNNQIVIGRIEGELRFPNDDQISGRHVAISLQSIGRVKRWVITDLQSRNGLFVRVGKSQLADNDEFLIGSGRYRFHSSAMLHSNPSPIIDGSSRTEVPATRAYGGPPVASADVLCEILASGVGARYLLHENHYWIGRDKDCVIRRAGDYFTKGQHALLSRSVRGNWVVQNNRSLNGVWLRMPHAHVELGSSCEFQLGEQRFRFRFGNAPAD